MKNYQKIKATYKKDYADIMSKNNVFWAFSNERLEEGKKALGINDNKSLISLGMGGFMPKKNYDKMLGIVHERTKRYNKELKKAEELTEQAILYELNNHECFYTGDIAEVINELKGIYTIKQIKSVYKKFNT